MTMTDNKAPPMSHEDIRARAEASLMDNSSVSRRLANACLQLLDEGAESGCCQPGDPCRICGVNGDGSALETWPELEGRLRRELEKEKAEAEGLRGLVADGLMSADCEWENRNEGHDWAEWCNRARSALAPYWTCPECGPRVKVDEDGCCATCGQDCRVIEASPNSPAPAKSVGWTECHVCGARVDPDTAIICGECGKAVHKFCTGNDNATCHTCERKAREKLRVTPAESAKVQEHIDRHALLAEINAGERDCQVCAMVDRERAATSVAYCCTLKKWVAVCAEHLDELGDYGPEGCP